MRGRGSVKKYTTPGGERWTFCFDAPSRRDGRRRQVRRRGFTTRAAALEAMSLEQRRWVGVVDPSEASLTGYLKEWIDHREAIGDLQPTTVAAYRRLVRQIGEHGLKRVDRITAADLDRLYAEHLSSGGRKGAGRSPRTTRFLHSVIRKALQDALRKGIIGANPADGATPPAARLARAPEPDVWSVEEAGRFLGAKWAPSYRRIVWQVGLHSGLRRGELCGLRWTDLEGDALSVARTRTTAEHEVIEGAPKSERSRRTLHLSKPVVASLGHWRREQAEFSLRIGLGRPQAIFTDATGQPWHPDALSRAWARDCGRALAEEIVTKRIRLHDLRHWHATALVGAGVDIRVVADRLGHADPGFTLRTYAHSDRDRDRAAADALAEVL